MPHHICAFYPNDHDLKLDTSYYIKTHMPLVQEKFGPYGLKGWEVTKFGPNADGTKPSYALQTLLIWDNAECVKRAMVSPEAAIVFGDVVNFCNKQPIAMGGDVLGSTRV
ncbi:uncharacterized protein A1O5_10003 [Cladophialophora psammophila CBS 110553]|uniref:EthD domain-containing protein n=1 Tax=Cladophialophora psammophila CBS 110553 TaxID=1182543 RepID=W9WFT9_9EURO|nr:uncharacterized protein A1O5_10003 [Cladophialophora psammophila CBS 110553]EXJ66808.1 hypothetical protein A1O5_10003 [Cladophialophora psammophila CBS 110553]